MRRLLLLVAACGAAPPPVAPVVRSDLVVEQGDARYAFDRNVITISRGAVVVSHTEWPAAYVAAAAIAAPDGNGRWVVAVDRDGVPWRISVTGERENVAARLGLAGAHVRAIASAGSTFAVDVGDAIAYTTDGLALAHVPAGGTTHLAVARGALARADATHVELWDLAHATRVRFPVVARAVEFANGHLVVTAADRVWIETAGKLVPRPAEVVAARAAPADPLWQQQVAPVFQRVCAHCHLPGGEAGIDLSTPAAWATERDEIANRVMATRTMPPAGTDLSDADRAALAHWLARAPGP